MEGSNTIYFPRGVLVIETDQIESGTATATNPIVAAVDGEVANIHVRGSGDQKLGRNRIAGRQAVSVLHDAARRSHDDCGAQGSALNASRVKALLITTCSG